MTRGLVTLATGACRAVFETAAVYLWLGLLAGTPVSFPVVLGGAVILGLVARTGPTSPFLGPAAAVAMALIGMAFGIPVYASGLVLLYLAWRMQSAATRTTSTYAIESSFALGFWLFVTALVAIDVLPVRAGIPHDLGGDALTLVIAGLLAMVLARSENLGALARLKDHGVEGSLFRRTGMLVIAALVVGAFILAFIVSPSLGAMLGVVSGAALFLAYWLIYLFGYVAAALIPFWQWLLRLMEGRPQPQKHHAVSEAAKKARAFIHHPQAAHAVELALLILACLAALAILYRLFSKMGIARQEDALFTDERLVYRRRLRQATADGATDAWPYSTADSRLRQAVGALQSRLVAAGLWPGPSATLRDALRRAGHDAPRLVEAYEAHRYGERLLPGDVEDLVSEANSMGRQGDGAPPGGRAGGRR